MWQCALASKGMQCVSITPSPQAAPPPSTENVQRAQVFGAGLGDPSLSSGTALAASGTSARPSGLLYLCFPYVGCMGLIDGVCQPGTLADPDCGIFPGADEEPGFMTLKLCFAPQKPTPPPRQWRPKKRDIAKLQASLYKATKVTVTRTYDFNGDGRIDAWDVNNDGILDARDTNGDGRPDQWLAKKTWDTNGDGKPDAWDFNGDGKPDAWDRDRNGAPDFWDTDLDGQPDAGDYDGDGRLDAWNYQNGSWSVADTDRDGKPDTWVGLGAYNEAWDTDKNGFPDKFSFTYQREENGRLVTKKGTAWDLNGDTIPDAWDFNGDGKPDAWDRNGDGFPNAFDTNGDGKIDAWRFAPWNDYRRKDVAQKGPLGRYHNLFSGQYAQPTAWDTDGDGYPDKFANGGRDTDGNGYPDEWDSNGDGKTDMLDLNGDGVPDTLVGNWPRRENKRSVFDVNHDGLADIFLPNNTPPPTMRGSDPGTQTKPADRDKDGKYDWDRNLDGKPDVWDTDGDGYPDTWDMNFDGRPDAWDKDDDLYPEMRDTNGDGKPDARDINLDGDLDAWDTNGDGRIDAFDLNYDGKPDCWSTKGDLKCEEWDRNGDGKVDAWDTDGDGRPDQFDTNCDGKPDVGGSSSPLSRTCQPDDSCTYDPNRGTYPWVCPGRGVFQQCAWDEDLCRYRCVGNPTPTPSQTCQPEDYCTYDPPLWYCGEGDSFESCTYDGCVWTCE